MSNDLAVGHELLTDRLALRRFTLADAPNLLKLDGDPQVMRYLERDMKSLAEIRARVLPRLMNGHARHPELGYWAALSREKPSTGPEFIGWFGLRPVEATDDAIVRWADAKGDTDVVELGYRLRRDAWGSGYATEGARAMLRQAFSDLAVREVVATTMAVNAGSRRVLEKSGLTFARIVHVQWDDPLAGTEHGEVEYRLSRDNWHTP